MERSEHRGAGFYPLAVSSLESREDLAKNMTSFLTLLSVLEVSCAIWGMSWEQRRKACEASGMRAVRFQGKPDPLPYILFLVESR